MEFAFIWLWRIKLVFRKFRKFSARARHYEEARVSSGSQTGDESFLMPPNELGSINLRGIRQRYDSFVQERLGAFGHYQLRLLLITQFAYVGVTGSIMCTLFDNAVPSVVVCPNDEQPINRDIDWLNASISNVSAINDSSVQRGVSDEEFYSLLIELDLVCTGSYVPTLLTTSVMTGGVFGAAMFGYSADRFGRRRSCIASLFGVLIGNLALLISPLWHWTVAVVSLFMIGFFGGGYLVVNLVLLLENVGRRWRLLCASLNAWPLGLMVMALIGYLTKRWDYYHVALAAICFPGMAAYYFLYESPRWLLQHNRIGEAEAILKCISRINKKPPSPALRFLENAAEERANGTNHLADSEQDGEEQQSKRYTYMDLIRCKSIRTRLALLSYSWFAASVISFGIYFNLGSLAGDRYVNTFLTGLLKGTLGVVPWLVSRWMGRKSILISSCVVTLLSCWLAVGVYFLRGSNNKSPALTAFALIGSAAIDPMWKINHLYSAELFPTVVRNMARAVCNIASRVGSVAAPQLAYLSALYFPLPFVVFGCLSLVHVVICAFLPETKGRSLPDHMPVVERKDGEAVIFLSSQPKPIC